jgi:hypothetical protein
MHAELIQSPVDTKLVVGSLCFYNLGRVLRDCKSYFILSQVEQHCHIGA